MKKLLLIVLALVFLSGCASSGISLKNNVVEIGTGTAAITVGYFIGKNSPEKVPEWNQWIDDLLILNPGDSVVSFEVLLAKGFDYVVDASLLKLQFNKLIMLFEFPELQPPNAAFLTSKYLDYLKLILRDFRDGLKAGKLEADG